MKTGNDLEPAASPWVHLPRADKVKGFVAKGNVIEVQYQSAAPPLPHIQEAVDHDTFYILPFSVAAIVDMHAQLTDVLLDLRKRGHLG